MNKTSVVVSVMYTELLLHLREVIQVDPYSFCTEMVHG